MPPLFLGRERELSAIDELLGDLERRGGSCLARGEAGIGTDAPLLVVIEDAQWLDADSCDVLAFRSPAGGAGADRQALRDP